MITPDELAAEHLHVFEVLDPYEPVGGLHATRAAAEEEAALIRSLGGTAVVSEREITT